MHVAVNTDNQPSPEDGGRCAAHTQTHTLSHTHTHTHSHTDTHTLTQTHRHTHSHTDTPHALPEMADILERTHLISAREFAW